MQIAPKCECHKSPVRMLCRSGGADTAGIADLAGEELYKAKDARMFCLAGIAGDVGILGVNSRSPIWKLVVDGCESDCARKILQKNGFGGFVYLRRTEFGGEKGKWLFPREWAAEAVARLRMLLPEAPACGIR